MEKTDREVRKEVMTFLEGQNVLQSATADKEGKPAASVMLYIVDEDFNFYVLTKRHTYKAQHLLENPRISFSVLDLKDMFLQVDGIVEELSDEESRNWVADQFADKATDIEDFWAPILWTKDKDYIAFKITPTWMRMMNLKVKTVHQEGSPFTEITV